MNIQFHGAAREVTGSCHLLTVGNKKILIDCGMFQGETYSDKRNHDDFLFRAKDIDAVLVTHAHIDHVGRIPKLVNAGFNRKILATRATIELAKLMWEDSLQVMKQDEEHRNHPMLYNDGDVRKAAGLFKAVKYGEPVQVVPGVTATWHDAGHILGSAFIVIEAEGKKAVFSGDLGNTGVPVICEAEDLPECDALVLESTYGAYNHENTKDRKLKLKSAVLKTIKDGGVVMIPTFAMERTQEVLYELNNMVEHNLIPRVPFFLDSPLAIRATRIFLQFTDLFNEEAKAMLKEDKNLFDFPGLQVALTTEQSKKINNAPQPKIIIAGSGMMSGGRIFYHLKRYLPDMNSLLLIIGFQAKQTLGRKLLEGAKQVEIYGQNVNVCASIVKIGGYSAHADQRRLIGWTSAVKNPPKQIFLVHGEQDSQKVLATELRKKVKSSVRIVELYSKHEI